MTDLSSPQLGQGDESPNKGNGGAAAQDSFGQQMSQNNSNGFGKQRQSNPPGAKISNQSMFQKPIAVGAPTMFAQPRKSAQTNASSSLVPKKVDNAMDQPAQAQSYFGLCHFQQTIKSDKPHQLKHTLHHNKHDLFEGKGCPVCQAQICKGETFEKKVERNMKYYQGEDVMQFEDFVRKLIPDQNNAKERMIKGCQVLMPETVFYRDGKVDFALQCDREYCLSQDTKIKGNIELRRKLPSVLEERRKDNAYLGITKAATRPDEKEKVDKQNPKSQKTAPQTAAQTTTGKNEKEKDRFLPFVIFRFIDRDCQDISEDASEELAVPAHLVVTEGSFRNNYMGQQKQHGQIFHKIKFLQTCVKTKDNGIGKAIHYDFMAPLKEQSAEAAAQEIKYDFKHIPDEVTLLEQGRVNDFAQRQCLKMCYYLAKVRQIEILRMKTEFIQDDNGNVWFTYAHQIHFRELKDKLGFAKLDTSQKALNLQQHQQQRKDMLLRELQEYEASLQQEGGGAGVQSQRKDTNVKNKMLEFMTDYYNHMKSDMGFNSNYGVEQDDAELDAVLKQLRPNTTAKNFREFLSKGQNVYKNQNWRSIAREVQAGDEKKKLRSFSSTVAPQIMHKTMGNFYNARQSHIGQTKHMENVMNTIEQTAKRTASQYHNTIDVNERRSIRNPGNILEYAPIEPQPAVVEGNRNVSLLKAELVRNNLVTRSDLMKLYQPPVKKSAILNNNPFYSKTIVAQKQDSLPYQIEQDRQQPALELWMANRKAMQQSGKSSITASNERSLGRIKWQQTGKVQQQHAGVSLKDFDKEPNSTKLATVM